MKTTEFCQQITNEIIASLENGVTPWRCPWDRTQAFGIPINLSTGEDYHGMNVVLFWSQQADRKFSTAHWLTYRQAQKLGGQVRETELKLGTRGIFYRTIQKATDEVDENGEPVKETIPVLRRFNAFNLDQIDGLSAPDPRPRFGFEPIDAAERLLSTSGVTIQHGGARASYSKSRDVITMPDRDRFNDASGYYATVLHELTHATRHESRCDRPQLYTEVSRGAYAFEELVAELGSLFLMSSIGLQGSVEGHDDYIDGWLSVLKYDRRAIFKAASQAEQAHQWLTGYLEDALPQPTAA